MLRNSVIVAVGLTLASCSHFEETSQPSWQTLFDGKSLEGWKLVNGEQPFEGWCQTKANRSLVG